MIKKILLGLLFGFISFINFSNAGSIQTIGLNPSNSIYDGNYKLTFLKGGGVLTNFFGQSKSVLSFVQSGLFRWYVDGKPYFYDNGFQGYFGEYRICDELTGDNSIPTNCISYPITGDFKSTFQGFFSSVSAGDYAYYDYEPMDIGSSHFDNTVQVCRSSNSYNASLCFRQHSCYNGRGCSAGNYGSLVNSKGLTLSFDTIQQARIGYAPGQNGYNGNRDNQENNTNTNTNNNYVCPTIAQVMQNMGENYNTGLCYNNTSYFNGTNFVQIEKEDIFTIFNDDYQNYTNRISIYRNNCTNANTTQTCQNAFSGEYKKYSIISNAINSNVDEKKLRNYCNLGLNYDPNATTCVASSGGIKEEYTTEEKINDIINNGIIPTPNTNQQTTGENQDNVLNALNKCESGDRECYINNRNFIDSLKNIYGKITGLFKERNGVDGIIPNYILRITFLTILFTVIFKK